MDKDWNLMPGDCLEVLPLLDAASVDVILTDPPYCIPSRHYCTRKAFPRSLVDVGILEHWFAHWFEECARVLKPTGALYVFCDGQSYPVFYALAYRHVQKLRPLVWDKQTSLNGYTWRHQHELILFAEMDQCPARPTGDGDVLRGRAVPVSERVHPAEKPVPLLKQLLTKSAPEGGLVLDPFCGSASTGVAALECGLSFLGIEREAEYRRIAHERLTSAAANELTLTE